MSVMINDNKISVNMTGKRVFINGVEYKKPGHGNTIVQSGDRIFINGYEFKDGKFKRTLRAFIECVFC